MIIAIVLLWINIMLCYENNKLSSYLKAIVAWTLYMFLTTEILSIFNRLDFAGVVISWLFLDMILFGRIIVKKTLRFTKIQELIKKIAISFRGYYLIFILIVLSSLYLAVKTVPYNWDSMTYHLSRVAHWKMNKSVNHYTTNIVRQIASPVLAEFVVLQSYILCKGRDAFVNVLQSVSFITNGVIVYGIAKKLNCKAGYCFLASLLYMTMPIAFAESVTTQVDNFAALWMLIFVYFIIDFLKIEENIEYNKNNIINVIILGICIAFGYLCKPSVSIAMVIFAVWLLIVSIVRKDKFINLLKLAACALPGTVALISIEMLKNIRTFGAIASPLTGKRQLIGTLRPTYMFINCVKNVTYNLPNIYDANSQQNITNFVHRLANILKVPINDPGISEDGAEFMVWPARMYTIDSAVNPVIIITTILCVGWIVYKRKRLIEITTSFSVVSILSFVIFCATLRWEAYVSRYMISYLALLCIAVCIQIQSVEVDGKYHNISYAIIGIVCFCSLIDFFGVVRYHKTMCDLTRQTNRIEGYFTVRKTEYEDYLFAADYIKENGYKNIGFFCGEDNYEYPLIKMLEGSIDRFEHVGVSNETAKYEDVNFVPDCIYVVGQYIQDVFIYHNTEYHIAHDYDEGWKYILTCG